MPYVTLSHRWSSYIPTLTKENLAQRLEGIPQETLPGTFRDAIQVTRRLRCSYLWIGSLCIILDDPKDWAEESSRMGDIYLNGIFNIAATAANDRAHEWSIAIKLTTEHSSKLVMDLCRGRY